MDNSRFIILLARQRSGTNAIRSVLETHPDIFCLNDVFSIAERRSPHRVVRDTNFFNFLIHFSKGDVTKLFPDQHDKLFVAFLEHLESFSSKRFIVVDVKYNLSHFFTPPYKFGEHPYLFTLIRKNGLRVLNVTRTNYLRFVLSLSKAQVSGEWYVTQQSEPSTDQKISVDVTDLREWLRACATEDRVAQHYFHNNPQYRSCEYEDIFCKATGGIQHEFLRDFSSWLGITNSYTNQPAFRKQSYLPLQETVQNYQEVCDALKGTEFVHLLNDEAAYLRAPASAPSLASELGHNQVDVSDSPKSYGAGDTSRRSAFQFLNPWRTRRPAKLGPDTDVLAERPWHDPEITRYFSPSTGMMRVRESALLYYLARDYYTGAGEIIDAGAFLGASASFLSRGLHDNQRCRSKWQRIHSFDKFIADDSYVLEFIRRMDENFPENGSFLELYKRTVGEHLAYIDIHQGDFAPVKWPDKSIEVLFVDIAKSPMLNRVVCWEFFPRLIPGRSVVIHQDYHHPYLPHIHMTMELLSEYFEIVDEKIDDSILFRNTASIPNSVIEGLKYEELSRDECLHLMDRAIDRLSPENRQHVELARARMLSVRFGDEAGFRRELKRLDERYSLLEDEHWNLYREMM